MQSRQKAQEVEPTAVRLGAGRRLLVLSLATVCLLAIVAAPAMGARTHRLKATFGESTFTGGMPGLAVDEASANVFAVDGQLQRVVIFGPEGGPPSGVDPAEISGLPVPTGIAVDNSASSPSKGALYVGGENGSVKKFTLVGEEYKPAGELIASPPLESAFGVAVDGVGNVFVADGEAKIVVEFSPAGVEIARLDVAASVGVPLKIAVDSFGDLFVTTSDNTSLYRFSANGAGAVEPGTVPELIVEAGHAFGLSVDLSTDALFVSIGGSGEETHVNEYEASCTVEGTGKEEHCSEEGEFGAGSLVRVTGALAVNPDTGFVYVADEGNGQPGSKHQIAVFGPTVIVPGAKTGIATAITGESATLNGSVDPSGSLVTECKFEWGPTSAYGNVAPCDETPAEIGSGDGAVAVQAEIPGLAIGSEYHFRLLATSPTTVPNEKGPSVGKDAHFTTLGPQVHCESFSGVGDTTARLEACIDPRGEDTTYFFQYVTQADFEVGEYAKATSAPLGGEAIGAGEADVKVAQLVADLLPDTPYVFRVLAKNASGTVAGPDRSLRTYSALEPGLPDGRVYEQVTPVHKNGAAPTFLPGSDQATADGEGIAYLSNGGFPGTEGAQGFPTFFASRGSDWSSQGVLPPGSLGALAGVLGWNADLSRAYLVQGSAPGDQLSFLERESAGGALRTLAAEGSTNVGSAYYYVGSAQDGSVVFFESEDTPKTAKALAVFNTYAWNRATGILSLAGALPGGAAPAKGSPAGSNEGGAHGQILQAEHALSSDGSSLFFHDAGTGQLYLRLNPGAEEEECADPQAACTVQVSKSQRTPVDPLDPKGKKPARFWQATPDGSLAFFTSPAKLTDDATTGPNDEGDDLYRYEAESGELIDLTPDPGDPKGADVQGVLGASEDGSSVYFAADGALADGASPGDCAGVIGTNAASGSCNLYLWHEGATTFVAQLTVNNNSGGSDSANWITVGAGGGKTSRLSADGQTLLFRSQEKLTPYDNQGVPVFYRYSAADDEILCVSCNPTGVAPSQAPATLQSVPRGLGNVPPASVLSRNLSADGTRVFFESPDKLVAADLNGDEECPLLSSSAQEGVGLHACQDVYEWEAKGSGSCESEAQNGGCLYLISDGRSREPAFFADADLTGENAFFFTDRPLVGQDKDQIRDIYTARVGGGVASQNPPAPPPPCEGEACKGPLREAPAAQTPGSERFSRPGNKKPSHQKPRKPHKKKHKKRHATRKQGQGR